MSMEYIGLALIQNTRTAFDEMAEPGDHPDEAPGRAQPRRLRSRLGVALMRIGSAVAGPRPIRTDPVGHPPVMARANGSGWSRGSVDCR